MRRSFIGFAALLAVPTFAGAQGGGFGIKGGLSYGNVSNSGALPGSVTQRSGIALGVSALTGGALGFGIEALYAQRGITSSWPAHRRGWTISTFPYVRLAMPTPGISPFIYAGPQVSFELKCGTRAATARLRAAEGGVRRVIGAGLRSTPSWGSRWRGVTSTG